MATYYDEDDRKRAIREAIMAAGFGMLSAQGQRGLAPLGYGGLLGMGQYRDSLQDARRQRLEEQQNKFRDMQAQMLQTQMDEYNRKQGLYKQMNETMAPEWAPPPPPMQPSGNAGVTTAGYRPPESYTPEGIDAARDARMSNLVGQLDPVAKWKAGRGDEAAKKVRELVDKGGMSMEDATKVVYGGIKPPETPGAVRAIADLQRLRDSFPSGSQQWKLYNDALNKATQHPPAATATAIASVPKGESAADIEAGKTSITVLRELEKGARHAHEILKSLDQLEGATRRGTFSGIMAPGLVGAGQFLQSLGLNVPIEVITDTRKSESIINQMVLQKMAANGGARGFTEKETGLLVNAFARIVDDPNSRLQIIDIMRGQAVDSLNLYQEGYARQPESRRQYFTPPVTYKKLLPKDEEDEQRDPLGLFPR